jgi:hypothetical protein
MKYLIPIFLLAGCASTKYTHDSKEPHEFGADYTDCQAKLGMSGIKNQEQGLARGMEEGRFMRMCIEGQGWQKLKD